ncbi:MULTISPECIES: hypothetical protein [Allobacillus]|uniref:Uncharacterized protein n=1 Tax=Allobacillus salarius TaxID=1955272 RepID=A0A556P6E7_9BACI|nr:hypothetical protein [Allobacillus salarius]TSJ59973.1 hypothetical protein FPQ13_12675 [Allobacillus salarius]
MNDSPDIYYVLTFTDSSGSHMTIFFGKEDLDYYGKFYQIKGDNKLISFIEDQEFERLND